MPPFISVLSFILQRLLQITERMKISHFILRMIHLVRTQNSLKK